MGAKPNPCRANMAHVRQPRPFFGRVFKVKSIKLWGYPHFARKRPAPSSTSDGPINCSPMYAPPCHSKDTWINCTHRRHRWILFFFLISLEPRVEWYKRLSALNTIPPRNRFTFLQSSCSMNQAAQLTLGPFGSCACTFWRTSSGTGSTARARTAGAASTAASRRRGTGTSFYIYILYTYTYIHIYVHIYIYMYIYNNICI